MLAALAATSWAGAAWAQVAECDPIAPDRQEQLISSHIFGGLLDADAPHIRRAFIFAFDSDNLVPRWAAWHLAPHYRQLPRREGRWGRFHPDPDVTPVHTEDYLGWHASAHNFARGHIVPFFVAGGDRNEDGRFASHPGSLDIDDPDDACAVFEINAMSNIAPQYHSRFNGGSGLWYQLETKLRQLADRGRQFHIIAGTVFTDDEIMRIGSRDVPWTPRGSARQC